VLIISDGPRQRRHRDPARLGPLAEKAQADGVTTSTLGFGLGYDERLLAALARGGAGNELFAEEADTAVALISGEVDGLLSQVAQAASLRVTWTTHVTGFEVLNELPVVALPDGAMLELGSFYAGEARRVLIKLGVPGIAALGLAQVATLDFTHVSLPDLVQHTTTSPVHVNVVPGDEAAGRIPDPKVRSEALFQQTQKAKLQSSALLSEGRVDEASEAAARHRRQPARRLGEPAPSDGRELAGEADLMDSLAAGVTLRHGQGGEDVVDDASFKSRNPRAPGARRTAAGALR
jgi:Ca-activated chloride channel family protein